MIMANIVVTISSHDMMIFQLINIIIHWFEKDSHTEPKYYIKETLFSIKKSSDA